jgi:hypothetical protein
MDRLDCETSEANDVTLRVSTTREAFPRLTTRHLRAYTHS